MTKGSMSEQPIRGKGRQSHEHLEDNIWASKGWVSAALWCMVRLRSGRDVGDNLYGEK